MATLAMDNDLPYEKLRSEGFVHYDGEGGDPTTSWLA